MTTIEVEGALKCIEDALYKVENDYDYIVRLNDFDDVYELDTRDGHRITVTVAHVKLDDDDMMFYEVPEKLKVCPECSRKWKTVERTVEKHINTAYWHLHCVCGKSKKHGVRLC